jgi:hypothetical protein
MAPGRTARGRIVTLERDRAPAELVAQRESVCRIVAADIPWAGSAATEDAVDAALKQRSSDVSADRAQRRIVARAAHPRGDGATGLPPAAA